MCALTTTWICDNCDQEIKKAGHGWVEWITIWVPEREKYQDKDMRIVHHISFSPRGSGGCQYQDRLLNVGDVGLRECQGIPGLKYMFSKIDEGKWQQREAEELICRIHVPGYERARQLEAANAGTDSVSEFCVQTEIKRLRQRCVTGLSREDIKKQYPRYCRPWTAKDKTDFREMLDRGDGIDEVAEALGRTTETIFFKLEELSVSIGPIMRRSE